jgi:hypothetical protein
VLETKGFFPYRQRPTRLHLLGHVDIGPGWRCVAGRVVVDENAAGGVQFDGSPQYLPRIHMDWVRHHDRYEPAPVAKAAPAAGSVERLFDSLKS